MTLAEAMSPRCYIVGDFVYHRPGRLRSEDLPPDYRTSAIVLYLQQLTTVTDIFACVQKMTGELHTFVYFSLIALFQSLLIAAAATYFEFCLISFFFGNKSRLHPVPKGEPFGLMQQFLLQAAVSSVICFCVLRHG